MSNTTIGTVQVVLSATHEKMSKAFGEAAKQIESLKNTMVGLVGVWASAATARAVAGFVEHNMDAVVSLQRQADQIGVTVQAMGGLRVAAAAAGVESEAFGASLGKMQQAITQARHGNMEMAATLRSIGLEVEDLKGKGTEEQLGIISDHLAATGDAGLRTSAAMKLFGDQGRALLPILQQGSAGLARSDEEARALGLTFTEIDTGQVVEAKQVLTEVGEVIDAVGKRIAVELAPYLTEAGNLFLDVARESNGFRSQVQAAVEVAVRGAVLVYDGWMRLREVWQAIRIGVMYMADKVLAAINSIIQTGQILANTWNATWELIKAGTANAIAAIVLDFDYLKSGVYNVLDGIANSAGRMLEKMSLAAANVNAELSAKLADASANAKLAMTSMATQADKDFKASSLAFAGSMTRVADGWESLQRAVTTLPEGSAAIAEFRQNLTDNMADAVTELNRLDMTRVENLEKVEALIRDVKSQAEARATARAAASAAVRKATQNKTDSEEIEAERKKFLAKEQAYSDFAGNIATLTSAAAEQNRAAFYVNKAAQMAQAEINAWMAYSNTLSSTALASMGPGVAQAFAATALAAGQVAVTQIAMQQAPGRANGGPVGRGGLYQVNERGPEMLSVGDKSYLMMGGSDGHVTSNSAIRGGASPKVEVHVHTPAGMSARTEQGTGDDGAPRIDVIIEAVSNRIAGDLATGVGPMSKTMERTYGLNRSRGATR